jgi:hypothetical protein
MQLVDARRWKKSLVSRTTAANGSKQSIQALAPSC